MKIAIIPAALLAESPARLDASFYVDPGGHAERGAEKAEASAAKATKRAKALREKAAAERADAEKRGVVVLALKLPPGWNSGTPNGPWEGE